MKCEMFMTLSFEHVSISATNHGEMVDTLTPMNLSSRLNPLDKTNVAVFDMQ